KPISSASFTMASVSSTIWRGAIEASRCVIKLNRPSFISNPSCKDISTAHDDGFARHVSIPLAEQDGDPAGDLAGLGIALERRVGGKLGQKACSFRLLGGNAGGRNRIDQDLVGREFKREGTSEAHHRGFGGGIMRILG